MLRLGIASAFLIASTIIAHIGGISLIMARVSRQAPPTAAKSIAWLLIRLAWMLIVCHLTEIGIWALFYLWSGCFASIEPAFYFSGVTYTTVGYGDLVLPARWRILGPVEALAGILMCGLSASIFFAINQKIYTLSANSKQAPTAWEN